MSRDECFGFREESVDRARFFGESARFFVGPRRGYETRPNLLDWLGQYYQMQQEKESRGSSHICWDHERAVPYTEEGVKMFAVMRVGLV
jgi:hypothetical protein